MIYALFYYTLVIMLIVVLVAAACLSAYLVSHKRAMLYASLGLLFYFFDLAFAFQDDFVFHAAGSATGGLDTTYLLVKSLLTVVTGVGFLTCVWLIFCDFLNIKSRAVRFAPGLVLAASSVSVLLFVPASDTQRLLFYLVRELAMVAMLVYLALRFVGSRDEVERKRMQARAGMYSLLWILVLLVIAEDIVAFMGYGHGGLLLPRELSPERNFTENILALLCAFYALRDAWRTLTLRFERPPASDTDQRDERIAENLLVYGKRNHLSERECEVLHLILLGKDNQNIASEMHLALSTAKVHVHNILQKTEKSNRQELIQDFWSMS